jgi:hypothetical protein
VAAPAAAAVAADSWMALLRYVKYTWGAGFFVAAFACNCLKTAADRGHLWKPANRWAAQGLQDTVAVVSAAILVKACWEDARA